MCSIGAHRVRVYLWIIVDDLGIFLNSWNCWKASGDSEGSRRKWNFWKPEMTPTCTQNNTVGQE
jgi:hypothetical protein